MRSVSSRLDARRRLPAAALSILLVIAGCASQRGDEVPRCPHCGDPVTVGGADGRGHVLPRLRLHADGAATLDLALGLGPWTVEREAADEPPRAPSAR